MNDVLKFGKKLFTASVVGVTIAWSMGLAALVPAVAQAATCPELEAGDLFKAPNASAVYYLTASMQRAYFPHEDVFKSWNLSFSNVKTVAGECLFAYPVATPAGIDYRPGSRLVKLTDASAVFAITPGNKLVQIGSESVAAALYGSAWAKVVRDVSPFHWSNYVDTRTTWNEAKPHDGMLVKKSGDTNVYYVKGGMLYKVDGAVALAATATPDVRTVSEAVFSALPMGSGSVTLNSVYENPSQGDGAVTQTTGNVTVSLSANTPAAGTVPQQATGVEFLKFNVTGSGTLDSVTVQRTGVGSYNDFNAVYLYDGATRLTSGRTVSSDNNQVTFSNLKLALSSYSKTLTVVGDLSSSATTGDQEGFTVVAANGSSASVAGNVMTVGSVTISSVTVDNSGSSGTFALGATQVEVARGTVNAGSATNNVQVKRITLTNAGSLSNSNLTNFKLTLGSSDVATAAAMQGDKVVFTLATPYSITKGDTKTFVVYADNIGGRVNDTVKFYVDETSDVNVVDSQYPMYGALLTNSFASGDQTYTVTGGDLTLSNNGPAAGNIGKNVTNVTLQKFSFSSTNSVTIKSTKVFVYLVDQYGAGNATSTNYDLIKNVKIVDLDNNNQTVVGPQAAFGTGTTVSGNSYYKVFTDAYDLTGGTTRHFAVVADIDSSITTNFQVYTKVDYSGTNYVKYVDNSEFVSASSIVPNTLTGNTMTIAGSQLTVARTTPPASTNVVKGAGSVDALGVLLTAGSADDLKITSLKFRVFASSTAIINSCASVGCDTAANTAVNTVSVYEDGSATPIATKNLSTLSGTVGAGGYYYVQMTGLNYKVPAGSSKKLVVRLSVKDSISAETWVMVDLDGDDDIDVETYADGKSVTENTTGQINTSSPVVADIATTGGITIAVDGNTPTADVVLSGTSNKTMSIYKFTPTKESFTLTGAKFTVDAAGKADNISKVMVTYKDANSATVSKECFLDVNGTCTFTDGQLNAYFPVNQTTLITVSANFATIDQGADSGDAVQLGLAKQSSQFSTSANLTNDFILLGASSNSKLYGNTNSLTLTDSSIAAQTVRKTLVTVAESDSSGTSHTTKAQDPVGVFSFVSASEPGSSQNSTLSSVTVQLSGNLIANAGNGNDTTTVYVYDGNSFDANHLMGSGTITGLATGASTALQITLSAHNEWTGTKQVYVVVDTTDTDFSDSSNNTEKLTTALTNFAWADGSATVINPVSGVPVYSDTYSY